MLLPPSESTSDVPDTQNEQLRPDLEPDVLADDVDGVIRSFRDLGCFDGQPPSHGLDGPDGLEAGPGATRDRRRATRGRRFVDPPSLRFGHSTVFRSRSPMRLAHALINHLLWYLEPPPGTLRLLTAAVVRGSAVLLPDDLVWAAGLERLLDRLSLVPFDSPVVDVDDSGLVRLTQWEQGHIVRSAPMEVAACLFPEHLAGGIDLRSRCSVLAAATNLIDPASTLQPQTALNRFAALLPVIEPVGTEWSLVDLATSPS